MEIVETTETVYVDEIVKIHMETFTGFFLTFLGKGFLKTLYTGFMTHPQSGVIMALENSKPIGFCVYSEDLSGFYKYLIKKKLSQFAWYAAGAFFRNPKVLFRLLRAFTYSDESKREESYVELSSIGVSPNVKNQGIGSQLIKKLCDLTDADRFEYIKLETDKDDNEVANSFYLKNGFILDHSYETPEGRRMNEYRYYLGEK
jgi:ribosomal protein S18 acetylase RimI-like enzyme